MLDQLEDRLTGDLLFGNRFTEADIRLFVTLIRYDAAYHGLLKTNLRRIADYPRLSAYMERVLRLSRPAGSRQPRSHQGRLLFDQGDKSLWYRASRARPCDRHAEVHAMTRSPKIHRSMVPSCPRATPG